MKSPHKPFDDELKERLQQYMEEPNENLWQGIISQVSSGNPEPNWVGWSQRISGAVVIGVMIMVGVLQYGVDKINANMFVTSLHQLQSNKNGKQEEIAPGQSEKKEAPINSASEITLNDNDQSDKESIAANANQKTEQTNNVAVGKVVGVESSSLEFAVEPKEANQPIVQQNDFKNESIAMVVIKSDTSKVIAQQASEFDTVTVVKTQPKNNKKRGKRQKRYTIYFTAMPTFGYQRVESNQDDNIIIESIDKISAFSTDRLGLRAELGVEFPFLKSKKFKVFGGFLYYQRKQTIGYTEKYLDSTLVSSGPNGEVIIEPQFSYSDKSIEYELRNIGIQLGFNYKLSNNKPASLNSKKALSSKKIPFPVNKLSHTIGTGLEFHKALNKTNEFDKANGFSNPSAYVFVNVYYRLQYPSTGRLRGIFQPTLNYSFFINENLNAPFYVKPYGLGLNFGCSYNF